MLALLKFAKDNKSFKFFETIGADVQKIDDLEQTDATIKELIKNDYTTIIMTSEVAGFSESIIKKYRKNEEIKIIITPSKL